jgi:hypothetical protein
MEAATKARQEPFYLLVFSEAEVTEKAPFLMTKTAPARCPKLR